MFDYARESYIDFCNILYEFDDINSFDFMSALEQGEDGKPEPVNGSNPVKKVEGESQEKEVSSTGDESKDDSKEDGEKKTDNPNNKLKNTSAFVSRLKEIGEKLASKIKEYISNLSDKLQRLQSEEIDRFLQAANAAKAKNGFNAIAVENTMYSPDVFRQAVAEIKAIIDSIRSRIDSVIAEYQRAANGTVDVNNNGIKKFNDDYGDNRVFSIIAQKIGLTTKNGADAKSVNTEFQDAFRGKKEKITLTEDYVNNCTEYLRNSVSVARSLVEASNSCRDAAKLITEKIKSIVVNPDTASELNNQFNTFTTNASKIILFASSFWIMAWSLSLEYRQNCRIVIQRAYKMSDKESKPSNNNTNNNEGASKPEEINKTAEENNNA